MTEPHATCAACSGPLYPFLARRSDEGWVHANTDVCRREKRRRRPCADCGRIAKGRRCRPCQIAQDAVWHGSPEVLDAGRWVPRGGVRVWQEAS